MDTKKKRKKDGIEVATIALKITISLVFSPFSFPSLQSHSFLDFGCGTIDPLLRVHIAVLGGTCRQSSLFLSDKSHSHRTLNFRHSGNRALSLHLRWLSVLAYVQTIDFPLPLHSSIGDALGR